MSLDTSSAGGERVGDGATSEALAAVVAAAELVLARRFGAAITLGDAQDLAGSGPAVVARVKVDTSPFSLPRTLVVKHYPGSQSQRPDPFAVEAASYQLFTALSSEERICPELIGHDADHRVLVLEDLGRAPTLEDKLCVGDSRAAERALLSWARALGRMHAATAHREQDFNALLRRLGATAPVSDDLGTAALAELPPLLADVLGVETSAEVAAWAAEAMTQVCGPGLRAFSPVDLSPENNLVTNAGVRFLDFERGCVRNPLIDVAHLRVPFAFWEGALALPAGMSDAMIAAWGSEVAGVWPELADHDRLTRGLLHGELVCVWMQTHQTLPALVLADEDVPSSEAAALVAGWRDLAAQAGRAGAEAIVEHAHRVADTVDARFGPGLRLAVYPAFR